MPQNQPRDAGNWAQPVDKLKVTDVLADATNSRPLEKSRGCTWRSIHN